MKQPDRTYTAERTGSGTHKHGKTGYRSCGAPNPKLEARQRDYDLMIKDAKGFGGGLKVEGFRRPGSGKR